MAALGALTVPGVHILLDITSKIGSMRGTENRERVHLPCNSQGAGLIDRKNGILKAQLFVLLQSSTLHSWVKVIPEAVRKIHLANAPRVGSLLIPRNYYKESSTDHVC